MDIFAADRPIPAAEFCPEDIAPFPQHTDLLYDHPTAAIHLPDISHRSLPAPQKLRPIRFNAKALLESSDSPHSPHSFEALENGGVGLSETIFNCQNMDVLDTGFSTHPKLSAPDGGPLELSDSLRPELPSSGGDFVGNSFLSEQMMAASPRVKIELDAEYMNLDLDGLHPDAESSSSSDGDGDSSKDSMKPVNQKRKRTRKNFERFVKGMMMKVIERQELMHKELIEIIEKRERERILREEAWKQQEKERVKRDEEIRAQETSRSLALISFIQNVLGHEIQIPQPISVSCPEEVIKGENDSNKRWPQSEVQALITIRTALEEKFRNASPKGLLWEEVSARLLDMGYSRTAKKCKEKWENINKYFKRSVLGGKKQPENVKARSYFHELDILYRNGLISSGNVSNSVNDSCEKE